MISLQLSEAVLRMLDAPWIITCDSWNHFTWSVKSWPDAPWWCHTVSQTAWHRRVESMLKWNTSFSQWSNIFFRNELQKNKKKKHCYRSSIFLKNENTFMITNILSSLKYLQKNCNFKMYLEYEYFKHLNLHSLTSRMND